MLSLLQRDRFRTLGLLAGWRPQAPLRLTPDAWPDHVTPPALSIVYWTDPDWRDSDASPQPAAVVKHPL